MSDFSIKKAKLKWQLTPAGKRNAKLEEAIVPLRQWPETAALLDHAAANGITISFSKDLIGTHVDGHFQTDPRTGEQKIELNPDSDAAGISYVLIHELRHVWQDAMLGINPMNKAREEGDPETAIYVTRVREADAYAFTNLMITRMQHAERDSAEVRALADRLRKASGATELDTFQAALINEYMLDKFAQRLPKQQMEMAQDFLWAIENMQPYDRDTLEKYHDRYTSPDYAPHSKGNEPAITTSDMRRVMRMGVHQNVPDYLDNVPDAKFREMVLKGVEPNVVQAVNLMKAFEAAAAKPYGIPGPGAQNFRTFIDNSVKMARAAPLPTTTPKSRLRP